MRFYALGFEITLRGFVPKIIQAGNSLAVTIPSKFAKQIGVRLGDEVLVKKKSDTGQLIFTFKNLRQLPLIK